MAVPFRLLALSSGLRPSPRKVYGIISGVRPLPLSRSYTEANSKGAAQGKAEPNGKAQPFLTSGGEAEADKKMI